MDKVAHAALPASETAVPTDLLASLLMEQASAASLAGRRSDALPAKIYAVMAVTSLSTFGVLAMGYQLLFSHQLFA